MFRLIPRPTNLPMLWIVPLAALTSVILLHLLQLNSQLFHLINSQAQNLMGPMQWETMTILGDGLVAMALLLPLYKNHPKVVIAALLSGILAALWVHLFKSLLAQPRPAAVLDPETIVILGPLLKQGSFPSGHTATLFSLLGCLALWLKGSYLKGLFPLLLATGLLAALSRSAVGAHWPLDILTGAAIGWSAALLVNLFSHRLTPTPAVISWLGRFLMLCTVYLLFVHHTGYINAQPIQHGLALSALALTCLQQLNVQDPDVAHSPASAN